MPWAPSDSAHDLNVVSSSVHGREKYSCRPWKRVRLYKLRKNQRCEQCCDNPSEEVHHCNGNAFDNRPSNLMALCRPCHSRMTLKGRIKRGR